MGDVIMDEGKMRGEVVEHINNEHAAHSLRSILLLGSTGSIGLQAMEIIRRNKDRFRLVGLAAGGHNIDLLCQQIHETGVGIVAVADPVAAQIVRERTGIEVIDGPHALKQLVESTPAHTVLNAVVGSLGLEPTLAALDSGAYLALANKESLVAGGEWVLEHARLGQIIPVDSEHSALAQCLRSGSRTEVAQLILTASGGPFREWSAAQLENATIKQASTHPTWSMGPMNTLNSASMVNKGLELIEAHLLFGIPYEDIEVTVHPQSIIHSMVTFVDGATIAQISPPSMAIPIALAMAWPEHLPYTASSCDFRKMHTWTFSPLNDEIFPAVSLAREAGNMGGVATAIYNAANEEAAQGFLEGKISFPRIVGIISEVLDESREKISKPRSIADILSAEEWARARAQELLKRSVFS